MVRSQRLLTNQALFDYYLVSSNREEEVFSQSDYYLQRDVFEYMVHASRMMNNLALRIIQKQLENPGDFLFQQGAFPLQKEIYHLSSILLPFFWVRFDVFQRAGGGIFFSEFNYDKPCAQREILVSRRQNPQNNPNMEFESKFAEGFTRLCQDFKSKGNKVAILVDPGHYEEVFLAHLYMDLLKDTEFEFVIAGASNLIVHEGKLFVFDQEVNIILRQFPTEFLHELPFISEVLELIGQGKVLMINDPRAIIGQTKSLFAYLWELLDNDSPFLTKDEKEMIQKTIPYTEVFDITKQNRLMENKDGYVVKAAYGRYSEEVYIGKMYTPEEWKEVIEYVCESDKLHIIQEFCEIKKEKVLRYNGYSYMEEYAYGNFGIYLIKGEFAGTCVRWSNDFLSCDGTMWSSAVGIRDREIRILNEPVVDREKAWNEIKDQLAFQHGYTDHYTCDAESFVMTPLLMQRETFEELKTATEGLSHIIHKAVKLVQDNAELFGPVLGLSDTLRELIRLKQTTSLTFLGRFDWVMASDGSLKVLEFNAETPGGMLESIAINRLVKQKLGFDYENPNENTSKMICESFRQILSDYMALQDIKTIGFVSSSFHEDWYTMRQVYDEVKHLPYQFVLGEISALENRDGKLFLYGQPLDAVYRYYPLDMLDSDPFYTGLTDAFLKNTPSINAPSTLICQSKAFFALLWELAESGFYSQGEIGLIKKYVAKTALERKKLGTEDYCTKPYFEREGNGVSFHLLSPEIHPGEEDYVFQERVDIMPVEIDIYTTLGMKQEILYPIIGTYVMDCSFGGILTRAGGLVTDRRSVYIPLYIKKEINSFTKKMKAINNIEENRHPERIKEILQ